jgi:hypothetical protein
MATNGRPNEEEITSAQREEIVRLLEKYTGRGLLHPQELDGVGKDCAERMLKHLRMIDAL